MGKSRIQQNLIDIITRVRARRPLVHSITNGVVMNWTANVCLAFGASPIMAQAPEELDEVCALSDALNLNIGTLDSSVLPVMRAAARCVRALGKPVVLDPVGIGASAFRRSAVQALMGDRPSILRANAGEVATLIAAMDGPVSFDKVQTLSMTRGVDSTAKTDSHRALACDLAAVHGLVVAMTGAFDIVTDGRNLARIGGGSALMTQVTGGGCALSALVAACAAVEADTWHASVAACAFYKGAAALAARQVKGPGTFAVHLLDQLANSDVGTVLGMARVEIEICEAK